MTSPYKRKPGLVRFRLCPRCKGHGKIPDLAPSRRAAIERSKEWAEHFHGQIVMMSNINRKATPVFGVGIAKKIQGGYWVVRVYTPKAVWTDPELSERGYIYPITSRSYDPQAPFPYCQISFSFREGLTVVPIWETRSELIELGRTLQMQ